MSDVKLQAALRGELNQPGATNFAREEQVEMMLAAASQDASEGLAAMLAIFEIRHKHGAGEMAYVEQFS